MSFILRMQDWATTQKSNSVTHNINRIIKQRHVMVSIDAGKALSKFSIIYEKKLSL